MEYSVMRIPLRMRIRMFLFLMVLPVPHRIGGWYGAADRGYGKGKVLIRRCPGGRPFPPFMNALFSCPVLWGFSDA